ncbi:hypothetical protein GCM10010298_47840 [Streptomyces microflavus]|uniref:Uncharacterized protein n=1 Tax=Streptomyces microflavus TaxID=1919 RepID=A0A7J0CHI6_STRMI|nr:hypothetical protein Smic_04720 [Streptomyces microflavus]GGX77046.1 hypothetical protein GCM10010298_47840 [Streptomyces microflavus]
MPQHIRSAGNGPIATKYNRVSFDLSHVQPDDHARADLLAFGRPLHDAVMDETIRSLGGALNQGTVLICGRSGKVQGPEVEGCLCGDWRTRPGTTRSVRCG